MASETVKFETAHPLEADRQASANELCVDRVEIQAVSNLRLKMAMLTDWNVRVRTHLKTYADLYTAFGAAGEFLRSMTTPPYSWVSTYQHGFTSLGAVEPCVVVAGPALFNLLGDIEPFSLSTWMARCHTDDLESIVDANMFSHERHKPFDQIFRVRVQGKWKWIRASSRSIGVDALGNHRYSGVIMDYTNFVPDDLLVIVANLDEESDDDPEDV